MRGIEVISGRHKVYAGEGLDGVGKTTVLKLLAEQTGSHYLYCMDGYPLRGLRSKFDEAPIEARYLFYLALNLFNFIRIDRISGERDIFVDRTALSTIAMHKAMGLSERWLKLMSVAFINQYDLMIYFTLNEEERRKRILERTQSSGILGYTDHKSLELASKIDEAFRNVFPGKTIIIPTDDKTPQQVVDSLKTYI